MDENREPPRYFELIQWRTFGCLILAFLLWFLCTGLPNFFLAD